MSTETFARPAYELRFQSLVDSGRALVFPCDAGGHVDMDSLGRVAFANYLYARAFVGREFLTPSVRISDRSRDFAL